MVAPTPNLASSYLRWNAALRPEALAVVDGEQSVGFADLQRAVWAAAARLVGLGAGPGKVVAVQLPNVWEYVALELAIPLLEAIVMPLPLSLGEAEVRRALAGAGARLLVLGEGVLEGPAFEVAGELGVTVLRAERLVRGPAAPAPRDPAPDPARVVEIALTSGSTGMPKLAALTAGLKQATFEGFAARLEVTPQDRVLVLSPLTQGIGGMCLFCLRRGAALVMLREARFEAEHALAEAARTRSTLLVGVPTNVIRMLQSPVLEDSDLSAARCTAVAGAPMPPSVAEAWERRTGSRVVSFYGSMDAGQLAVGSPSDPAGKRWHTVGRPHDSCEALICDPVSGVALARGAVGEICMRGPTVQERYWGESFGPCAADGWAHMGDLGVLDADGYLHVVGRLKDMVIRGGANINPYEVEEHLRAHPRVIDACVVGRPDPELGERAMAYVVGELSLDELKAHMAARGVAKYKWPEFLECIAEMPLAGPGKVNRRLLKEKAGAASSMP